VSIHQHEAEKTTQQKERGGKRELLIGTKNARRERRTSKSFSNRQGREKKRTIVKKSGLEHISGRWHKWGKDMRKRHPRTDKNYKKKFLEQEKKLSLRKGVATAAHQDHIPKKGRATAGLERVQG